MSFPFRTFVSALRHALPQLIIGALLVAVEIFDGHAALNQVQNPSGTITNSFAPGLELTQAEVEQVIAVATRCGLTNIAEIKTTRSLPKSGKTITVQTHERVDGQSIYYDTLMIFRIGWIPLKPGLNAETAGDFWADLSRKQTTHLREYGTAPGAHRIRIGQGVAGAFADQVVAAIKAKKIWSGFDIPKSEDLSRPYAIERSPEGGYELLMSSRKGYKVAVEKDYLRISASLIKSH